MPGGFGSFVSSYRNKIRTLVSTKDIEARLRSHVEDFQKWVRETFSQSAIAEGQVDDPGYPEWKAIAKDVAVLFSQYDVRDLTKAGVDDLLFLTGRNWDLGWIINWLTRDTKNLSNIGALSEAEFYFLCQHALTVEDEDAQSQFPANFTKFDSLTPQRQELLLQFSRSKYAYTRRQALEALMQLKYPHMEELIAAAWETEDEWVRIDCLRMLKRLESPLLSQYEERALADGRHDLLVHLKESQRKNNA